MSSPNKKGRGEKGRTVKEKLLAHVEAGGKR